MTDKRILFTPDMEEYGLAANTWEKMRHRGIGPRFIRLGGRVAYDRADVEAWLESQKRASTSAVA